MTSYGKDSKHAASDLERLLLVGPGSMGLEYLKVIDRLAVPRKRLMLAGRSKSRVASCAAKHDIPIFAYGGIEGLHSLPVPSHAIICVPHEQLAETAKAVLDAGCRKILLEKPGALDSAQMRLLAGQVRKANAELFIACNRRFLPSVDLARKLVEKDGGILTAHCDFTEMLARIYKDPVAQTWSPNSWSRLGIANSIHVLDLAFHFAGPLVDSACWQADRLDWHPSGARFVCAGRTEKGALFTGTAAWNGAGNWGLELVTRKRRLILRPLETLHEQKTGSIDHTLLALPAEPSGLKPGLFGQVKAFLKGQNPGKHLCSAQENIVTISLIERMLGYAKNGKSRKRP